VDLKTDIYTSRLEVVHPEIGSVSGTLGAEVQLQDANTRGPAERQPTADTWNVGLFVFEEIDLAPWTFNAGVRGDFRTIDAEPNDRTTDPAALENDYLTLSGALGSNVKVANGVALAANLSSGFRAPSIFELYTNGVHGGVAAFQVRDPNLDPERAYSADVSVRVRRDRVTAELTGYVNAINNYIFLENTNENRGPAGNGRPIYEASQTDAVIPGLEAKVETRVRPWLHVGGQAAVLGGTGDELGDGGGEGDLPLLPTDNVEGFVHLTPDDRGPLRSPRVELALKHGFDKDAVQSVSVQGLFVFPSRRSGRPMSNHSSNDHSSNDHSPNDHSPSDERSAGGGLSRKGILGAVLFLFFSYLSWQVANPYRNQPYEKVPHGDHVHYVPKDWNEDVPISRFPRQPPEEGERITPDGEIVPAGPDAESSR